MINYFQISNVIFVDSPVGTGFSYARNRLAAHTSDMKQVHQLHQFLQKVQQNVLFGKHLKVGCWCFHIEAMSIFLLFCSGGWIIQNSSQVQSTLVGTHTLALLSQCSFKRSYMVKTKRIVRYRREILCWWIKNVAI